MSRIVKRHIERTSKRAVPGNPSRQLNGFLLGVLDGASVCMASDAI
jgi:hypothetical protein